MWRKLPHEGIEVREVRLEGSGKVHDLVIVPRSGERVRFATGGRVEIATVGHVTARTEGSDANSLRVTFSGTSTLLERAEVDFDGSETDWESLWRRARMRSRPWWRQGEGDELDLDWSMPARLTIAGQPS